MLRLSDFIREHTEDILAAWETFARDLPSGGSTSVDALRHHAEVMLTVIAQDLDTPQTERQRAEKARGVRDATVTDDLTAAAEHGLGRAEGGFSVESMIAEFRALRASVISLWREKHKQAGPDELEQMTRFDEAIDQAIAESVARYTREVEATRDRFFAVLGHDLRTPLGVITMSSQLLLESTELTEAQRAVIEGMQRSGRRMIELVRDLLDLALTRLGSGIPVRPSQFDMGSLVRAVVEEVAASNPDSQIDVETVGALDGTWDRARLAQALINLVDNAVRHGSRDAPIKVTARGDQADTVTVSVANQGPPIPPERLGGIFDAMKGGSNGGDRRHLGLGLYIVDKIVDAHGGKIDLRSSEQEGTTVTVSLPRRASTLFAGVNSRGGSPTAFHGAIGR